ncbi:MAG: YhjD/YihY/BrkB family envelope integrity protein, partial [Bdellovibrionota bacterium]
MRSAAAYLAPLRFLKSVWGHFTAKGGMLLAAALAFELILYSIPFFIFVIFALGVILANSADAVQKTQELLQQLLPQASQAFAGYLADIVGKRRVLGVIGLVLFLYSSNSIFGTIREILNTVFDIPRRRSFFRGKGGDLLMIFFITGLFAVSVISGFLLAFIITIVETLVEKLPLLGPR